MNAEEHPQTEPAVKWCTTIFGSNAFAQQENIEPLLSTLDYDDKYAVCMNWSTIFILKGDFRFLLVVPKKSKIENTCMDLVDQILIKFSRQR